MKTFTSYLKERIEDGTYCGSGNVLPSLVCNEEEVISEVFDTSEVSYGSNKGANNNEFYTKGSLLKADFIVDGERYTFAMEMMGKFRGSIEFKPSKYDDAGTSKAALRDFIYVNDKAYSQSGTHANSVKVFTTIMRIVKDVIEKYKLKRVRFVPASDKLESVYKRITNSKKIISMLSDIGFSGHWDDDGFIARAELKTHRD